MRTGQQYKYKAMQGAMVEAMDLKVGDTVKVLRKANDNELGWRCSWNDSAMDRTVGSNYKVDTISEWGVRMDIDGEYYTFPIQVLTKVETNSIKISDEYSVIIQKDGSVKVGCQHISYDVLNSIYDAAVAIRK